jgi:hypothetical protein
VPAALTSGWIDTGLTQSFTLQVDVELEDIFGASVTFDGFSAFLSGISITTRINGGNVEAVLTYPDASGSPQQVVLVSAAGPVPGTYLPAFTLQKVVNPLRLGATIDGSNNLIFSWFADASTATTWTVQATVIKTSAGTDPPVLYPITGSDDGGGPTLRVSTGGRISNFRFNGVGLGLGPFTGADALNRAFSAPTKFTVNLDAVNADGTAVAADASCYGARTCPATFTQTLQTGYGLVGGVSGSHLAVSQAAVADPWLSAQPVTPFLEEQAFQFEGSDPKNPSASSFTTWNVGTLTINSPVSVLRSANAWAVDSGTAGVGGTSTVPIFTVTGAPATVRRELASSWRNWNNPVHVNYHADDQYRTTKHDYYADGASDDVWGWSSYAYLDCDVTPASAVTLTFEITWAILREGGAVFMVVKTHTATWTSGARATKRLDLLFPVEVGRPFHGERVDRIRIIGLPAGVTTIHALSLVAVQNAYVKLGGQCQAPEWLRRRILGSPPLAPIPAGVMIAQDGAFAFGQWGGDPLLSPTGDTDSDLFFDREQDHQSGRFGGLAVGAAASFGGSPGKTLQAISAWFDELSRLEGLTAAYSGGAITTALTDGYGNSLLSSVSSLWITPNWPHARIAPNAALTVTARMAVASVNVPTGLAAGDVVAFERLRLGMSIEAQCVDSSGNRAGAGSTVAAKRTTAAAAAGADATEATALSDASGFVTLPVRTGLIGGSYFQHYLLGT